MGKFFNTLVEQKLYNDWAGILDWIFDDDRFSKDRGWNGGYVGQFAKKVKRLPYIGEQNNYICDSTKNLKFPIKNNNKIQIIISKRDGESKDIIRHIRNGIAHGKTSTYQREDKLYIEIKDYNKKGEQTAYIYIPLDYIREFHTIYRNIEKSKNNNRKPDNAKKKSKK